jgi:hypothetical protein
VNHYIVRGYNLHTHTLLPRRIADKTQASWVMQGWAVTRATSANGRWIYTLYANPGGYPFVHALDTVNSVAHCVGLPWPATNGEQGAVFNYSLRLNGHMLAVRYQGGPARYGWPISTRGRSCASTRTRGGSSGGCSCEDCPCG